MGKIQDNAQGNISTSARRNFNLLWVGQSLSLFGDQLLLIALPLLAISLSGVTVSQAALLRFAFYLPFLLFGLLAGSIIDRLHRRLTMIVCDSLQAIIFIGLAVLALSGSLSFLFLMLLVGIGGTTVIFFQVAYTSYLPELFSETDDLQRGNSRLYFSESVSKMLGPVAAGPIIIAVGMAGAIVVNAITFVLSVLSLLTIRHRAPVREIKPRARGWIRRDIKEGLSFVFRHTRIEPVISCGVVYVLFLSMIEATLVLYCRKVLGLSIVSIGIVMGAAAAGFPVGNLLSTKLLNKIGIERTLVLGACVAVIGLALTPIMGALHFVIGLILVSIIHGIGEGIFGPTSLTLRQTETPDNLMGRVNSVQRFLIWGTIPIGSLLASFVIHVWSLSGALWIGGLGTVLCLIPLMRRGILKALFQVQLVEVESTYNK